MKSWREIEELGWMFYLSISLLLTPLGIFVMYQITYDTASVTMRIFVGLTSAFLLGGVVTALANDALQRVRARKQKQRRKEEKKKNR